MKTFEGFVPKIYIILVNYNGWLDTIECLESILNNNYKNFQVIVVDNGSADNSFQNMLAWADGLYILNRSHNCPINFNHEEKPVNYEIVGWENGTFKPSFGNSEDPKITFVKCSENRGFAAGNNLGITLALQDAICDFIWLLNNDTVICQDSLEFLVQDFFYIQNTFGKNIGLLGSKLMLYDNPKHIQAVGGHFNKFTTINQMVGMYEEDKGQYDFLKKVDYPIGASIFASVEFVKDIGPMCEDYFLYYEELDWVTRGKKRQWEAWNSFNCKIYHKHGKSTGQKSDKDFFVKNKFGAQGLIKFYEKHYRSLIFLPYFRLFASAFKKLISGNPQGSYQIIKYIFD